MMMETIGSESGSRIVISGCFVPSGKNGKALAALSRTSCAFKFTSVSSSNSRMIWEYPSALAERRLSSPAIANSSSSSRSVTSDSIVAGEAPSRVVSTVTMGMSTWGNRLILTRGIDMAPSNTNAPTNMTVMTGRRIERSAIHIRAVGRL